MAYLSFNPRYWDGVGGCEDGDGAGAVAAFQEGADGRQVPQGPVPGAPVEAPTPPPPGCRCLLHAPRPPQL